MSMMELQSVYRTDWAQEDERRRHNFRSVTSSWSSINQIAFTSDGPGENSERASKRIGNQSFIHIFDPDKPWDIYSIVSGHADTITHLHWHPSGHYLLSADRSGVFKLWSMKNNLVNEWCCQRTVCIDEKVVCLSWLGTSVKFLFSDVKSNPGTTLSFPVNKTKHPLANLYSRTRDGWIAVTETGKVCFVSTNPDTPVVKIEIGTDLQGIQAGDIAFSNDGCVILGLADGLVGSVARFFKVTLQCTSNTSVNITCVTLQTLSPDSNKMSHPYAITNIKFVCRHSGAHVLIINKGLSESCIERWHLKIELQQLHELCQKKLKKPPPIMKWECRVKHSVKKHIASLAIPWLPVDPDKVQSYFYPRHNLILGFDDGTIRALNSCSLEIECELKGCSYLPEQSSNPKRPKTSFHAHSNALLALHYSSYSCCIMGWSSNGSMYLFKCQPTIDVNPAQVSRALVNLLEYGLVSGWDWWDVLVILKHQQIEILDDTLERFEEDYNSIPHLQMSNKYLSIKAGLLSLYTTCDTKVIDCYSKQFLLVVSNFFKSLIPSGDDKLTAVCHQTTELDLDNFHQSLDPREFEVDSAILKTLHPLAQWLADFSVSLIGIHLVQAGQETMPGASLLHDRQCILLLKQLLLLLLIWEKQFPGILPNCVAPMEKLEYLKHLFVLISKLWLVNNQVLERSELEGTVMDLEQCFSNHLNFYYQSLILSPCNQGVTGKNACFKAGEPDEYVFGEKRRDRMLPLRLLTTQFNGHIDVVRKLFLGDIANEKLRQCTKCEGVSLLTEMSDSLPEKAWEQRWNKSCMCGGAWRRLQNS